MEILIRSFFSTSRSFDFAASRACAAAEKPSDVPVGWLTTEAACGLPNPSPKESTATLGVYPGSGKETQGWSP